MRNARLSVRLLGWITFATTLTLAGCGGSGDGSTSSSPGTAANQAPSTTSAPLPTAGTASATLTWLAPTENTDGTALTDLAGFRIHYGTDPAQLASTIVLSGPGLLTYVIDGLPVGTRYYFAVMAMTRSGVEGVESPVVSKLIS
jgi:hypothetical protein